MKNMLSITALLCATLQLSAMPTKDEALRAEPVARKMLAKEHAALRSGAMTRSEVADAALRLAEESDAGGPTSVAAATGRYNGNQFFSFKP